MEYSKQPQTIDEQLLTLQERGLIIDDIAFTQDQLSKIGYFRLANYWRPMEENKHTHSFKPNSKFSNALNLYYFDKELRVLLFSAIQTVEVALRTKIMHHTAMQYGSFWLLDSNVFTNQKLAAKHLEKVKAELERSKEDFILEHKNKYSSPEIPPVWKTMEVITFGTISKIYRNLTNTRLKKNIAREFTLPQHRYLESWMMAFSVLRNLIAHHMRIWNRNFSILPQLPYRLPLPWVDTQTIIPTKIYTNLCCLTYLQNQIHPNNQFVKQFKSLLTNYPNVDTRAMGFPENWQNEPLWRE